jgi:hypothetical protein
MGRYALILVSGFIFTFSYIRSNLDNANANLVDNFLAEYERRDAMLVARSLAQMALVTLSDSLNWRTGYANVAIGDGTGWVMLQDSAMDASLGPSEIRVTASASSGSTADTVIVLALLPGVPPGVRGGITANSVVETKGNLVIDGRNHDLDGNLLMGEGTFGVSTTQTFDQGGNSRAGGTSDGVDFAPSKPANIVTVEQNASYVFPNNPDDVFGYPDGTLMAAAQSGANGGQYVTDPDDLTFPLSGVTYVHLEDGERWQAIHLGESSGVLVVHSDSGNAVMKNLNSGTFKGLIIADDVDKIHTAVIGAVISMTTSPSGNCIGNGTGEVLYSSAALQSASSVASGGNRVTVASWFE